MLELILTLSAYTAIVSVVTFIAVYSKMYDWHRHPMGRVMNFSLMSAALVAIGEIVRTYGHEVGMVLSSGAWVVFSILLVWRMRLLIVSTKQGKQDRQEEKQNLK